MAKLAGKTTRAAGEDGCADADPAAATRQRILSAAFQAFMERGYAGASTLEIATRARVSKRELYALFGTKRAMLLACIAGRARRMRLSSDLPQPRDRASLLAVLVTFGTTLLREVCDPAVTAVYRLAIVEADSPEVARTLEAGGRKATWQSLADFLARAQRAGLIGDGDASMMAGQFIALLWGDLQMRLLLRLADPPTAEEMERRARVASEALLALHAPPHHRMSSASPARRRRSGR